MLSYFIFVSDKIELVLKSYIFIVEMASFQIALNLYAHAHIYSFFFILSIFNILPWLRCLIYDKWIHVTIRKPVIIILSEKKDFSVSVMNYDVIKIDYYDFGVYNEECSLNEVDFDQYSLICSWYYAIFIMFYIHRVFVVVVQIDECLVQSFALFDSKFRAYRCSLFICHWQLTAFLVVYSFAHNSIELFVELSESEGSRR